MADHPHGFEWCINSPAVDGDGVVYANSEDGNVYSIDREGNLRDQLFLQLAEGASYTPLAIGEDGRIYAENDGHLFALAASGPGGPCVAGATTLCIDDLPGDARFEIRAHYQTTQAGGRAGDGRAIPLGTLGVDRGGLFWFFSPGNPELLVKLIDAVRGKRVPASDAPRPRILLSFRARTDGISRRGYGHAARPHL